MMFEWMAGAPLIELLAYAVLAVVGVGVFVWLVMECETV